MRILITNDDGITAPGLAVIEAIAADLAGPDGEVWVVAPAFEQSGVSHCISYIRPMMLEKLGERRYAVDGSPADCVLAGLYEVLKDSPPDLVLSGVNRGHNVAEDTLYSGTIGGAIEATLQGFKAIAMSQYYSPSSAKMDDPFEAARVHGADICRRLMNDAKWHDQPYGVFYNINFPPVPASQTKGVKTTVQGHRPTAAFGVEPHVSPNGRRYLWITTTPGNDSAEQGTDARETSENWITVTPLRADLTAHDVVDDLKKIF
ncbi:MAG: 5'/3'-nucleotidase SurE [Alphaproteobacteria bacterium]